MHYAIIAAGEGSRLAQEGLAVPKPLVRVAGQCLIDRLIGIFLRQGAESISIIINKEMMTVKQHLEQWNQTEFRCAHGMPANFPLRCLVQSTPSSMHSFEALSKIMPQGKFCLTTVDTIFLEKEFATYIQSFQAQSEAACDGLFAVTAFVDDEKPLWVDVDEQGTITNFKDKDDQCPYVSGGIYALTSDKAFPILHQCIASGQARMRNYQRALISGGCRLHAYPFSKIIDVDHVADIEKAEAFLRRDSRTEPQRVLGVVRDLQFSPGSSGQNDGVIIMAVADRLQQLGCKVKLVGEAEFVGMKTASLPTHIFHMARSEKALKRLAKCADRGFMVVNAPQGVVNCRRETMTQLLLEHGIPYPQSQILDVASVLEQPESLPTSLLPGWLKRGDSHTVEAGDVCFVELREDLLEYLDDFASRGIARVVLSEHLHGDLVKFYGVAGSDFFYSFYPQDQNHSKFGLETLNDALQYYTYDEAQLKRCCDEAAAVLGVEVYGGDCIVAPDGTFKLIDFNDWPSFSPCREEAAACIASFIKKKIDER